MDDRRSIDKFFRRGIAVLLSVAIARNSGVAGAPTASAGPSTNAIDASRFCSSALSEPSAFSHLYTSAVSRVVGWFGQRSWETEDSGVRSPVASRREFLKAPAAVLGLLADFRSRAQPFKRNGQALPPWPSIFKPFNELPRSVRQIVGIFDELNRTYQDTILSRPPTSRPEYLLSPSDQQRVTSFFVSSLVYRALPLIFDDMVAHGWMDSAERHRHEDDWLFGKGAHKSDLFESFLPNYFARYGLFFNARKIAYRGRYVQQIEIRPVVSRTLRPYRFDIDGRPSVVVPILRLDASRVRTPADLLPKAATAEAPLFTSMQSGEVLEFIDTLRDVAQHEIEQYRELLNAFPLLKVKPAREAGLPSGITNASVVLWQRSVSEYAGKEVYQLSESELEAAVLKTMQEAFERHEAFHSYEFQRGLLNADSDHFWAEARAETAPCIDSKTNIYTTASLLLMTGRRSANHPGDVEWVYGRLAYWQWRRDHPFSSEWSSVKSVENLPQNVQDATWDRIALLDEHALSDLYRHAWQDTQPPTFWQRYGTRIEIGTALLTLAFIAVVKARAIIRERRATAPPKKPALPTKTKKGKSKKASQNKPPRKKNSDDTARRGVIGLIVPPLRAMGLKLQDVSRQIGMHEWAVAAAAVTGFGFWLGLSIPDENDYLGRAQHERSLGHWDEAMRWYTLALRANLVSAEAHCGLGAVFARRPDDRQQAISEYLAALAVDASNTEALNGLGHLYRVLGQYHMAESYYLSALDIDNRNTEALMGLGAVALTQENWIAAQKWFSEALKIDAANATALEGLNRAILGVADTAPQRVFDVRPELSNLRVMLPRADGGVLVDAETETVQYYGTAALRFIARHSDIAYKGETQVIVPEGSRVTLRVAGQVYALAQPGIVLIKPRTVARLSTAGTVLAVTTRRQPSWFKLYEGPPNRSGVVFEAGGVTVLAHAGKRHSNDSSQPTEFITDWQTVGSPIVGVSRVFVAGGPGLADFAGSVQPEEPLRRPGMLEQLQSVTETYTVVQEQGRAALLLVLNGIPYLLVLRAGDMAILHPGVIHQMLLIEKRYGHVSLHVPRPAFRYGDQFRRTYDAPSIGLDMGAIRQAAQAVFARKDRVGILSLASSEAFHATSRWPWILAALAFSASALFWTLYHPEASPRLWLFAPLTGAAVIGGVLVNSKRDVARARLAATSA